MNKKTLILLPLISGLLLSGCQQTKKDDYVYPEEETNVTFDYSNNNTFKNQLSQIPFQNNMDVSESLLTRFLSAISQNDYYADSVIYTLRKERNYIDSVTGDRSIGDFLHEDVLTITRDNEKNSLSGAVKKIDDNTIARTDDPTRTQEKKVTTTGTYSLVPNVEPNIGRETYTYTDESYSSITKVGFNHSMWLDKMNLTCSDDLGIAFKDALSNAKNFNEIHPENGYETTIKAIRGVDLITVTLISTLTTETQTGNKYTVKYEVKATVTSSMIANWSREYTRIESDANDDYIVEQEFEQRELSRKAA